MKKLKKKKAAQAVRPHRTIVRKPKKAIKAKRTKLKRLLDKAATVVAEDTKLAPSVCRECGAALSERFRRGICKACRPKPTSLRFSVSDYKMVADLRRKWKTDGPTTTIRKALEIACQLEFLDA